MSKLFNICNLYVFLGCLYALQGIIYDQGMISQGILAIFLTISIYYFVKVHAQFDVPIFFRATDILLLVSTIYGIIMMMDGQQYFIRESYEYYPKLEFLKNIYLSLLPIYSFYYFAQNRMISAREIRIWTIIFIVVSTIVFRFDYQAKLNEAMTMGWDTEEFTNNNGYVFLSLIPLFFFFDRYKVVQYSMLIYSMVFILLSMKRGAILIGLLAIIWFIYRTFKAANRQAKIALSIIIIIALVAISQYILYLYNTSDYFQLRLENTLSGDSSGRDIIYNDLYNHIMYSTTNFQFIFGIGANGTLNVTHNLAHNDWLEIATNHGAIGLLIYLGFWAALFFTLYTSRNDSHIFSVLGLWILIYFIMTFFSMSYNNITMYSALALGVSLACKYNKSLKPIYLL